ncbi:helix-turn-helix protein [Sphingobacterium allocomposti]|uniref:Helix-turn-helix protein n=2 Tax=Sphingobacterium allocomposti TaxID=415956 RepID=A0A5S5D9T2_9SPHI|nr:helix-turn-helix protein [Sphingobacterium composti Yoo et al. 2007 non Ten et al. 2007]
MLGNKNIKNMIIEILEREMSQLDYLLIEHVKSLREKKKWTQQVLSKKMGVAISFVSNVESLTERHKYSIRHLALLANAFKYKSVSKLFDFPTPTHDKVVLRIEVTKTVESKSKKSKIIKSELKEIILLDPLD